MKEEQTTMTRSVKMARAIIGKSQTKPKTRWSWLMRTIAKVVTMPARRMEESKFVFANTKEAADHNSKLLKRHRWSLEKVLISEKGTMIQPGLEFRELEVLEP